MDDREWFENSYFYFREAVETLVQSPSEQCDRMGNYNVAWELKDDVSRGAELLQYVSSASLSAQQRHAISDLISELESVPTNFLPGGGRREDNLAAMSHPTWEPLRLKAAALLEVLASATERNRRYLFENGTNR